MAYIKKQYYSKERVKVFKFLMETFDIDLKEAQRWIDKGRVFFKGRVVTKKAMSFKGKIEVVVFETVSRDLKPIFQTKDFLVYDKPSGVLVHPQNRHTEYSITHEVKNKFGKEANIVHRIDKETSGLLLCSKHKKAEKDLKLLFENREVKKEYIAKVRGKFPDKIEVDKPISRNHEFDDIKLKVFIDEKNGKPSKTIFELLEYDKNSDISLVKAKPLTGRQHQIRVHLYHIGFPILGDPLYGVDFENAEAYLDGKLDKESRIKITGAERLLLHAYKLEFKYKNRFIIVSDKTF